MNIYTHTYRYIIIQVSWWWLEFIRICVGSVQILGHFIHGLGILGFCYLQETQESRKSTPFLFLSVSLTLSPTLYCKWCNDSSTCSNLILVSTEPGFSCLYTFHQILLPLVFDKSHPNQYKWYLLIPLICMSPAIRQGEHSFLHLLAIDVSAF